MLLLVVSMFNSNGIKRKLISEKSELLKDAFIMDYNILQYYSIYGETSEKKGDQAESGFLGGEASTGFIVSGI